VYGTKQDSLRLTLRAKMAQKRGGMRCRLGLKTPAQGPLSATRAAAFNPSTFEIPGGFYP